MAVKWIDVEYEVNGVTHKGKKQITVPNEIETQKQVKENTQNKTSPLQSNSLPQQQQLSFDTKTKTKEELKNYIATVSPNKDDISMHHAFLMQCPLPIRRLPPTQAYHKVQNGKVSFMIEKGRMPILNKETGNHEMTEMEVPSGAKARLVLSYINNYAYHNKTHIIDMGKSLTAFMEKNYIKMCGTNYKEMRQQIYNITASHLYFNVANADNTKLATRRISISDFYLTPDEQKMKKVWQDELHLTQTYYESLLEQRRPVDFRIMVLLQANPRAMDLYLWLTYRAPWLKFPLKITYAELHALFGQSIKESREFKRQFLIAIEEVIKVYPAIQLDFSKGDYITIYKSEPSVPKITGNGDPLFERR